MGAHALRLRLKSLRGLGAAGALALVLVFCSAGMAVSDDDWSGGNDDDEVEVIGELEGSEGTDGVSGIKVPVPGPWTQRIYTPACDGNTVQDTGPNPGDYEMVQDTLCPQFTSCPAEDDRKYFLYERAMGADNRATDDSFSYEGVVCRSINAPTESEPPTVSIADIIDRARALAPTPTFVIEPAATSYVNIPTNFAAQAAPVTVNVTVLGLTVPVEFAPRDPSWTFGDGGVATGLGIENASVGQSGAVEHVYARAGAYDVSVTVPYDATIMIPGGTPITFPTPISRTAAPQTLPVGEIQSVVTNIG